MRWVLCGAVWLAPITAAHAQDYVTDKLFVGLHAGAEKDAPVVKALMAGTPLSA